MALISFVFIFTVKHRFLAGVRDEVEGDARLKVAIEFKLLFLCFFTYEVESIVV